MKAKIIIGLVLAAGVAGGAWWAFNRGGDRAKAPAERKIAYYQSSMHPWIKSDRPGNCTICGMKLAPVYEGEKGFATEGDIVALGSNSIQVINVQTELVKEHPIARTLTVAGRIEADQRRVRIISAYVDGRIEKLFHNYLGAEVKAGEPLAVLYSPELLAAEQEYLSALAQTDSPASERLRDEHLRLAEGARQRLKRLGLTDADVDGLRAKGSTNYTTQVLAPIGGTILARSVLEGQYVKQGDKMFEIADLSKLWFRFDVYEQDLPWIGPGVTVRVSSPGLGTNTLEGTVAFINPNISEASRSAQARVELDNPLLGEGESAHRALYNGLYAEGRIELNAGPALAVPRGAVIDPGDFPRVYVENGGGAYEMRRVKLGRRGSDYWEVLEGVGEDERVVTAGALLLDSQAQIVQSASAPAHEHGAEHAGEPVPAHEHPEAP